MAKHLPQTSHFQTDNDDVMGEYCKWSKSNDAEGMKLMSYLNKWLLKFYGVYMQVFYICKFDSLPCISIFIVLVTYWLPMLQWLSYAQHIATTRSKGHWFWLFTFLYFTSYRTALNFHGSLILRTFYRLQNYFNENFDIWTTVFLLRIARMSVHNISELCCQICKGHPPKRYLQHCFADSCELELNCACTAFHGKLIIMYLLWHRCLNDQLVQELI